MSVQGTERRMSYFFSKSHLYKLQVEKILEKNYENYLEDALSKQRYLDKNGNYTSQKNAKKIITTIKNSELEGSYIIGVYSDLGKIISSEYYKIISERISTRS